MLKTSLLLCICLSNFILFAQQQSEIKIIGEPKPEPSELVSREIRDANGDVCAGLIIYYSDLPRPAYQSNNGIVKVNPVPGKDFLFLSPDERQVEIYAVGFLPLKIFLGSLGIKLQSGKTWSITVTGDKRFDASDNALFEIQFSINVDNPYVSYNTFAPNLVKGKSTIFKLPAGNYSFRFSKEGYSDTVQQVKVSKNESIPITLQPSTTEHKQPILSATISITSEPSNAEILLNGQQIGVTPFQDIVSVGEYRLELRKPLYQTDISQFTVKAAEQKQIHRVLTPKFGYLTVTSIQGNSSVTLDGKPLGFTPINKRQIESGFHTLKISSPLYHDSIAEFTIKDDETKIINATLLPAFGSLEISSTPEDSADVFIDGEPKGKTPLTLNQIPSGKYLVKVSKQLYGDGEEQVIISDGQITHKVMRLSQNFGELNVKADSSTIYLNNKQVAKNIYSSRLLSGKYILKAERSTQYDPDEKEIILAVGEKKNVALEPTGKFGEVYLFATPQEAANASIYIDGEKKGVAPLPLALLIGNYSLTVKRDGYLDQMRSLVVKENDKQKITIEMLTYEGSLQEKRDTWGFYKWISAATALGAGVATYYFNKKVDSSFDEYQNATTTESTISMRNRVLENSLYYRVSSMTAITFSVSFVATWIVQSTY